MNKTTFCNFLFKLYFFCSRKEKNIYVVWNNTPFWEISFDLAKITLFDGNKPKKYV